MVTGSLLFLGCTASDDPQPLLDHSSRRATTEQQHLFDVIQIDAAGEATCALTSRGEVYCWGRFPRAKTDGEPRAPFGHATSRPTRIPGPRAMRISVSHSFVAMTDSDAALFVAGGIERARRASEAFEPTGFTNVARIFKTHHAGSPLCWLEGNHTVLCTNGDNHPLPARVLVDERSPNCFATPDSVQCSSASLPITVGEGCSKEMRTFRFEVSSLPVRLLQGKHGGVCALGQNGALHCARAVSRSCLETDGGDCLDDTELALLSSTLEGPFTEVSIGHHATGLGYGLRSDGSVINFETATVVPNTGRITTLTTSAMHTCGLRTDGRVACWGLNEQGQLGNGAVAPRSTEPPSATLVVRPRPPQEIGGRRISLSTDRTASGPPEADPIAPSQLCPLVHPLERP